MKNLVRNLFLTLCLLMSLQAWAADNEYGLKDNIQDGVILHCFDWTYEQIKEELPNIAAAGFSAVQTSPAHPREPAGAAWYMLYQPYDYKVGENGLGTKEGLTALCSEAHQYGVKVIVDVVANHTNGDLRYVASFWQDQSLYHDYQGGIDYSNRWQVTHGRKVRLSVISRTRLPGQVLSMLGCGTLMGICMPVGLAVWSISARWVLTMAMMCISGLSTRVCSSLPILSSIPTRFLRRITWILRMVLITMLLPRRLGW